MKAQRFLFIVISFFFFTTSQAQDTCVGCSPYKQQWVWARIYNGMTQQMWEDEGINPDPTKSLKLNQQVPFVWQRDTFRTKPATTLLNSPWLLIEDWYDTRVVVAESEKVPVAPAPTTTAPEDKVNWWLVGILLFLAALLVLMIVSLNKLFQIREDHREANKQRAQQAREQIAESRATQIRQGADPALVGPMIEPEGLNHRNASDNLAFNYKDLDLTYMGPWHKASVKFLTPTAFHFGDGINSQPAKVPHPVDCYVGQFVNEAGNYYWLPSIRRCGNGIYLTKEQAIPKLGEDFTIHNVLEGEGWEEQLSNYVAACKDLGYTPKKADIYLSNPTAKAN